MPRQVHRVCQWLPYKSHPLYKLRFITILTIIWGFVFCLFAILSNLYDDREVASFLIFTVVLLFLSFIFIFHDLVTYAISTLSTQPSSISNTDTRDAASDDRPYSNAAPTWPSKRLVISDLIFALLFQWFFWAGFFVILNSYHRYYSSGSETFGAYANLANFAASIEHGVAFWKELIARKKAAWRRDLEAQPCRNCGHVEHPTLETEVFRPEASSSVPPDGEVRPVSRSSFIDRLSTSKVTLPKWVTGRKACTCQEQDEGTVKKGSVRDDVEEPLLVTPDESTTEVGESSRTQGYGTLSQSVESIEAIPEMLVKKKDKGKKRLVEVE